MKYSTIIQSLYQKAKVALKLKKPAYIRMCIFELIKVLMCEFYYNYIKSKHGSKSRLLFTDTDSFMYEIKTEDIYETFGCDREMFDFSNYSTKSKYNDNSNKLIIGKMKDETESNAIEELVGLKQKMCSFLVDNNQHKKQKA